MTRAGALAALALVLAAAPAARALERPETGDVAQNYLLYCGGCHRPDGSGVPHRVPALAHSFARLLATDGGRDFLLRVPGVANSALSDAALAAVMNWCVARFAPASPAAAFTAAEVAAARHRPLLGVRAARHRVLQPAGAPPSQDDDY